LEANDESPLMEKLEVIASQIGKFGMFTAILIIVVIWIKLIIQIWVIKTSIYERKPDETDTEYNLKIVFSFLDALIIAVTVVVVAVPEGLPLAVTLALA